MKFCPIRPVWLVVACQCIAGHVDTGAAVAVVPVWSDDDSQRSFAMFYLPPTGDIWLSRPGVTDYLESGQWESLSLRNDAFKKAVEHAKGFIGESGPL